MARVLQLKLNVMFSSPPWCSPRYDDTMHGTGYWRTAQGEETRREYQHDTLVREGRDLGGSPIGRNTQSDE
jgi:hypothetical protein